ncbi:MAG: hypothetical protein J1E82_03415, partial [Muribaculaceae bacterium]|nr:hypothetical protein [Muribaculaceae bacterium]
VITVDLNNLDLAAGDYSLVIGEGYVDVISEDYEYWESNPEIVYEFTVETSGVNAIGIEKDAAIYTIQGVKVNTTDLNNLNNGIYIIGGKKVVIRK